MYSVINEVVTACGTFNARTFMYKPSMILTILWLNMTNGRYYTLACSHLVYSETPYITEQQIQPSKQTDGHLTNAVIFTNSSSTICFRFLHKIKTKQIWIT